MNDAPRRQWNILDEALRSCGMVPTRADRCCYVLYSLQSREQAWEHWIQGAIAQQNGIKETFIDSREQSETEAAFEKTLDPIAGSPAGGKSVAGIINLFVYDLFRTGGKEMEQRVLTRLTTYFQVGSEDWNDEAYFGTKKVRWREGFPKRAVHWSQSKHGHWWVGRYPSGTGHEARPSLHLLNAQHEGRVASLRTSFKDMGRSGWQGHEPKPLPSEGAVVLTRVDVAHQAAGPLQWAWSGLVAWSLAQDHSGWAGGAPASAAPWGDAGRGCHAWPKLAEWCAY